MIARVPDDAALNVVFVAERSLVPERAFLVAPPATPPASVSAIAK